MASEKTPDHIFCESTEKDISRHGFVLDDLKKSRESIISHVEPVTASENGDKMTAVEKDGYAATESGGSTADTALDTPLKLTTKALEVDDDPSESPYTFRAFALGIGLACFGATIAEIFYFKPQTVNVNTVFLVIIAYCIGEATTLIPRKGPVGRFLNPGRFNQKEHVFILIMAGTASAAALGTEQLAVQTLYYNEKPNPASAIFLLFSSQCLGYGLIGMMRRMFIYPTKFVWPTCLPNASLLQSMHSNKSLSKKRLRVFWYVGAFIMVWEIIPEYIFPLTIGISIFCLANQNSEFFSYLFGGANGDEGLGFLSWCMDWQYITVDPLVLPLNTLINQLIGYVGCIGLTLGAYYLHLWRAKNFPFMAQDLFLENGTVYDQTQILNEKNQVDMGRLQAYGLPWFSTSNALSILCMNAGVSAAVVHTLLWNWNDIKFLFAWMNAEGVRKVWQRWDWKFWSKGTGNVEYFPGTDDDPHFAAIRAYKETPDWWYNAILILSAVVGLICCYQQDTGLPWWAFLVAVIIAWFLTLIYGCMFGLTGFYYQPVTAIQMIGAYIVPRRPVANMMFVLYGSNSLVQGIRMMGDLKLSYYTKLPPRACFVSQVTGTLVGAIINWVTMNSIVDSRREELLSVKGTAVWSGQNVQTFNAQAVAWGGAGPEVFGRNGTYWQVPMALFYGVFIPLPFFLVHKFVPKLRWMRLDYLNTYIILTWLGWLSVGINSSLLAYFTFGFLSQFYLRRYRPVLFSQWLLTVTAAIGGGVAVIIFILTFAVQGGAGVERPFPVWWGNNRDGNVDRCKYIEV